MGSDLLGYKVYSTNDKRTGYIAIGTTNVNANVSVEWIQRSLNMLYPNNRIKEDGLYGEETVSLVRKFQQDNGLVPDGQFGENSYNALISKSNLFSNQKTSLIIKESVPLSSSLLDTTQNNNSGSNGCDKMWDAVNKMLNLINNSSSFAKVWDSWYTYLMDKHRYFESVIPKSSDPHHCNKNYKQLITEINSNIRAVRMNGIQACEIIKDNFTEYESKHFRDTIISRLRIQMDLIANNPIYCTIQKFRSIVSPITKVLEKIPGLGLITDLIMALGPAIVSLLRFDTEGFRNNLVKAVVSLAEGAVLTAVMVFGGLISFIVFLVLLVIDYFFFSDHPGETLIDKHTSLKTRNLIVDYFAMDKRYQNEVVMASIANLNPVLCLWYFASRNKQYSKALSEWIK